MDRLRLAIVADRVEPFYHGGYERHIQHLVERLARHHSVTLYTCLPRSSKSRYEHLDVRRIGPSLSYVSKGGTHSVAQSAVFALTSLLSLPSMGKYDFVDVLGIPYVHLPGLRIKQTFERWRWGLTVWEAWYNYAFRSGILAPVSVLAFRTLLRLSLVGDHPLIVGSESTKVSLESNYGIDPHRIFILPPGVNGIASSEPLTRYRDIDCIYVGRLDPYKRVGDLVAAVSGLVRRGISIVASVVGEGPEMSRLRKIVGDMGLMDHIRFEGRVDEDSKRDLLRRAKVFVLPSEREGFSIATLEAIANGAFPLVARPPQDELFGPRDMLSPRLNETTFPVGDSKTLEVKIAQLLASPSLRDEVTATLRKNAQRYDLDNLERAYVEMIRSTLKSA